MYCGGGGWWWVGRKNVDNMNVMVIMRGGAHQLLRKLGWGGTLRG